MANVFTESTSDEMANLTMELKEKYQDEIVAISMEFSKQYGFETNEKANEAIVRAAVFAFACGYKTACLEK